MLAFLIKNYQALLGIAGALVLSTLLAIQKGETRHWTKQANQFETLYHEQQAALLKTQLNYIDAADKARQADAENLKRVQAEQASINKEHSDELEARLNDARARYDRLLKQQGGTASANPSGPGAAPVPSVPNASGQPDQAALEDQLLATEQALQLDELIKWVKRQSGVEVSK
jgi:hypothetical protein